jgi:hypothetical protein
MNHKRVSMDGKVSRENAVSLCEKLQPPAEDGQASDEKEFQTSQVSLTVVSSVFLSIIYAIKNKIIHFSCIRTLYCIYYIYIYMYIKTTSVV